MITYVFVLGYLQEKFPSHRLTDTNFQKAPRVYQYPYKKQCDHSSSNLLTLSLNSICLSLFINKQFKPRIQIPKAFKEKLVS